MRRASILRSRGIARTQGSSSHATVWAWRSDENIIDVFENLVGVLVIANKTISLFGTSKRLDGLSRPVDISKQIQLTGVGPKWRASRLAGDNCTYSSSRAPARAKSSSNTHVMVSRAPVYLGVPHHDRYHFAADTTAFSKTMGRYPRTADRGRRRVTMPALMMTGRSVMASDL